MKRPEQHVASLIITDPCDRQGVQIIDVYKATDIDPLLDELERLKADEKTVFPKVGDMVLKNRADGVDGHYCIAKVKRNGDYEYWNIEQNRWVDYGASVIKIRPLTRPTREEVIAKYGITDEELEILTQTEQQ